MPIWTRRKCLMKKTGHEKSRDTVPLSFRATVGPLEIDYIIAMSAISIHSAIFKLKQHGNGHGNRNGHGN
jgi:hypothetical protein